ncbi:MAG: hypothetical protein IPJ11_04840 [Gemmatimonadetes bacterium]|nr:hypothetical protein [Gemmatimonadota bacterium]
MPCRLHGLALTLAGLVALPMALAAQDDAREVAELRRRIGVIRAQLPAITEAAEYAAGHFKGDSAKRILVSRKLDPGLGLEFFFRAGGHRRAATPMTPRFGGRAPPDPALGRDGAGHRDAGAAVSGAGAPGDRHWLRHGPSLTPGGPPPARQRRTDR